MINAINKKSKKHKVTSKDATVYAVGGGKGGIGKSFMITNLAMLFAKNHHKTLIIDLDFGGANTHTYLEMRELGHSVFDFLGGKKKHISEVIQKTHFKNLSIITAHGDWTKDEDELYKKVPQLLKEAKTLGYDSIFLDLGAGTHIETLSGFLEADYKLTLVTPEPTSVENTYFFLKKVFFHQLKSAAIKYNLTSEINELLKNKTKYNISKPSLLIKHIEQEFGQAGSSVAQEVRLLSPYFVINQCRTPLDYKLAESLSQISRNYFGIKTGSIGHMSYDNKVWQSIRSMKPLSVDYPNCSVLTEIEHIYRALKRIEKNNNKSYSLAS